jgi:hypothetical protein
LEKDAPVNGAQHFLVEFDIQLILHNLGVLNPNLPYGTKYFDSFSPQNAN